MKNAHILHYKYSPKLDRLVLKCMPNLHNILDWAKSRFELESNLTIFVKNKLWMNETRRAKIAVIQNVEIRRAAPLGVKNNNQ